MYTRYKYFAIVVLLGFFTPFCAVDDDFCNFPSLPFFDIEGLALYTVYQQNNVFRINASVDTTFEFRRTDDVVIDLTYLVDHVAESNSTPSNWSDFLVPKTLACTPEWGFDGSKEERHAGLTITTILAYSPTYPAGSIINDEVLVGKSPTGIINSPLDSLVRDTSLIQGFGLALKVPSPTMADTMQLKIGLKLDTGEAYELLTPRFVYTQ